MNDNFSKGIFEFKEHNYQEALDYFDKVSEDNDDYRLALFYRILCLIELRRCEEALEIIDPLIAKEPNELLWSNKVTCHILLEDKENAFKALHEFERVIDRTNKISLVAVAKFYEMLGDFDSAMKYCNDALDIDGQCADALYEKAFIAMRIDDPDLVESVSDKIMELKGNDILSLTPVFMLKLFRGLNF